MLVKVPAWVWIAGAGVGALPLLSRCDGQQTERLHELDRQQQAALDQSRHVAQDRKAVVAASTAADREIARLRLTQAKERGILAAARDSAARLAGKVDSLLSLTPDSIAGPVRDLLRHKDTQIASLGRLLASDSAIIDTLTHDRDRWKAQSGNEQALAAVWKQRATDNLAEAKRGCLPLIGCVSRTATLLVGAGLGVVGGLAAN